MSGKLFLVGTPIGNLGDLSPRGEQALRDADFIAAEDTRVTMKLLNHFDIRKSLVSYFEHNKYASGAKILERIIAGENCALVTDAGMPAISDPGEELVRMCADSGVEVLVVPGPAALVSAVALSALPSGRFCFEGFLSTANKSRREHLESLRGEKRTMIFYEAPHKLMRTLEDMKATFGADRRIALCRELTKLHEQTIRTTLGEAVEYFSATPPKGEFVLVIDGAPDAEPEFTLADALAYASELKPDMIVDIATLTGACAVALGTTTAGLFTNNDDLGEKILKAGEMSGERFWKLPMNDPNLRKQIKSPCADLVNSGGRYGGAITAAMFLEAFVGKDIPWAHLDIAAADFVKTPYSYYVKGASGFGARTLAELVREL